MSNPVVYGRKGTFKTVKAVWKALDAGHTVYWTNRAYKIFVETNDGDAETRRAPCRMFSARGNKILCVRCIENYFGSVLDSSELGQLFIGKPIERDAKAKERES